MQHRRPRPAGIQGNHRFLPLAADPRRRYAARLEHFRAKWIPVRVKKMRQNKKIEAAAGAGRRPKPQSDFALPRRWRHKPCRGMPADPKAIFS